MRVLIVGYGMAGSRLATELRARSSDIKITVLGAERHRAYNRILLSNVLAGKVSESDVGLAEADGAGVMQIHHSERGGRYGTVFEEFHRWPDPPDGLSGPRGPIE